MRFRFTRRGQFERDMEQEMRAHIERRAEDLARSGVPLEDARRRALIEFGGLEATKEDCREASGFSLIDEIAQDIGYTARMLRKSPGYALVAMAVLSIGIGACTAMFSIVDSILLRALPFPNAGRLVRIFTNNSSLHVSEGPTSYPDFMDWERSGILEAAAIYSYSDVIVNLNGRSERALGGVGSSGFFTTFGVRPLRGRLFNASEDRLSSTPVVLLSENFWRNKLGANENVVGSTLRIDGKDLSVVGVVPAFLAYDADFQLWMSPTGDNGPEQRENRYWRAVGRMRPDLSRRQTEQRLRQLSARLAQSYPASNKYWGVDVADLKESLVGDSRTQLSVLFGAVLFVLLIVCANVAALNMIRAKVRERELSIRASLGASRRRLIRQLITESMLVTVIAAALGLALATAATYAVREHGPADLPRRSEIQVDVRALLFAAGLAMVVGLLSGVAPGLQAAKRELEPGMRENDRRSTAGRSSARARSILVTVEVILAVVLLSGSGLLIKSFWALSHEDVGFNTSHLLTFFISIPSTKFLERGKYQSDRVLQYIQRLEASLRTLPGVLSVGVGMYAPVGGGGYQTWQQCRIAGAAGHEKSMVHGIVQVVTPDYFPTLGIPFKSGRSFTPADRPETQKVAIVNEAFARAAFGQENPVGHELSLEGDKTTREIVGVVGDIKPGSPGEEAPPQLFLAETQNPVPMLTLFIRTQGDPALLSAAAQRQALQVDPDVPAYKVRTAEEIVSRAVASKRFLMQLTAGFAGLSLILALVGMYGVLAYTVAQRTREFGVRVALGARRSQVAALVLREGLTLALVGIAVGVVASIAVMRIVASLLYKVKPQDPKVLITIAAIVFAAATVSCWIPARRAANVDPATALRWE